ncbi:hypothetical protein [Dyella choica]|uniref:Uncharacterized protein n=1 Tax=Dyella choica TaxID=1927959 RepID=A0A3S0S6L8_9GAMM|nr:hypothetical protein [Dyella choica]RUL69007.1 hypothetical protein EKH80_23045 [Dyella choica]
MKPKPLAIRLLEWGFDVLLLIYPQPFRARFGREMRLAFSAEAADVHRSAGAMALVPFFIRIILDSLVSSGREYLDMPQRLLAIAMVLVLVFVDWLTFHDIFEPHTVRDYLTLVASILVFAHMAVDLHRRRIAAR